MCYAHQVSFQKAIKLRTLEGDSRNEAGVNYWSTNKWSPVKPERNFSLPLSHTLSSFMQVLTGAVAVIGSNCPICLPVCLSVWLFYSNFLSLALTRLCLHSFCFSSSSSSLFCNLPSVWWTFLVNVYLKPWNSCFSLHSDVSDFELYILPCHICMHVGSLRAIT